MKLTLDLQFGIPIWRLFLDGIDEFKIPNEFIFNNKVYNGGITILQFGCYFDENTFLNNPNYLKNFTCPNPILCAPNDNLYNLLKKYRPEYEVVLANHNAFINENIFNINNKEKKYDIIINSSFTYLKRLYLSNKISNKVYIGYKCSELDEFNECMPKDGYMPNFEDKERVIDNFRWINIPEKIELLNQSKIGCIFSAAEGACFSSSEYLLCGLPVVSTECEGGREIWYNNDNSIICKPNEDSVRDAVNETINKLSLNIFNSENIRNNHIILMNEHRHNLTNKVLEIYQKILNNKINYFDLFDSLKYYHSANFINTPGSDTIQSAKEKLALDIINSLNIK